MNNDQIQFNVGVIVEIDRRFGHGENGIIYEIYRLRPDDPPGCSVITESGRDLGGFSRDECDAFLTPIRKTECDYQFESVTKLHRDFETEIKPFFKK